MVAADLAAADASDMAAGVAPPVATSVEVDVATATLTSETVDVGRDTATTRADIDEVAEAIVAVEAVIEVTGKASEALNETSAPLRTLVPTPAVIAPIIADVSGASGHTGTIALPDSKLVKSGGVGGNSELFLHVVVVAVFFGVAKYVSSR